MQRLAVGCTTQQQTMLLNEAHHQQRAFFSFLRASGLLDQRTLQVACFTDLGGWF